MSMHGLKNVGYANSCESSTLDAIAAEVMKARDKFPGTRFLLAALVEEVGELAEAIGASDKKDIRKEAMQVCAVAIRIIEEGDATTYDAKGFLMVTTEIGMVARAFLQRGNWAGAVGSLAHWVLRLNKLGDPTFADLTDAESKS